MRTQWGFSRRTDLPLDVGVLLLSGVMLLAAGGILIPVSRGLLPVYENGLQGLLLFVVGLHMVLLGNTPFGEPGRSPGVFLLGTATAAGGIVTCFVPDLLGPLPRWLLFLCLAPGGAVQFLGLLLRPDRSRAWLKLPGVGGSLVLGCGLVYLLAVPLGLVLLQGQIAGPWAAGALLVYGGSVLHLSWVLHRVRRAYPQWEDETPGVLSRDRTLLLLVGLFMVLLGGVLLPVDLGLLPFSGSAQLGLLMVLFSVQMLAFGSTPLGSYPRSRPLVLLGTLFAAWGTLSCLIPDLLTAFLTVLVGGLNLAGGVLGLGRLWGPLLRGARPSGALPPLLVRLFGVQTLLNLLSLLFGTSMLVPSLIPGLAVGAILGANGAVLLYLVRLLVQLDRASSERSAS